MQKTKEICRALDGSCPSPEAGTASATGPSAATAPETVLDVIERKRQRIRDLERESVVIQAELSDALITLGAEPGVLRCMDCRMPYGNFPLDTHVSDEQWRMIHPGDGGVLCANCIVARAKRQIPGISVCRVIFE